MYTIQNKTFCFAIRPAGLIGSIYMQVIIMQMIQHSRNPKLNPIAWPVPDLRFIVPKDYKGAGLQIGK